jgi:Lon protease-like protein
MTDRNRECARFCAPAKIGRTLAETSRVPIFPLDLVLFPGQSLPLHIFEERYKAMLQRCLRENLPFGVVLIEENSRWRRGTPRSIGTLAWVNSVNEVPEGRCPLPAPHSGNCYHIICRGGQRFRVAKMDRREAEYLVADIEAFPDEPAPAPAMAMVGQRVAFLFDEYYRALLALNGGWQRQVPDGERTILFERGMASLAASPPKQTENEGPRSVTVPCLPSDPESLANIVAAELSIDDPLKQELLELPSALARLQREAEIIAEETPELGERLKEQVRRRFGAFGRSN